MIEIVCPSCDARYQVPDDSIGPEGRRVTCSACSHKWRAYPEGAPAPAEDGAWAAPESAAEPAGAEASDPGPAEPGPAEPGPAEQRPAEQRPAEPHAAEPHAAESGSAESAHTESAHTESAEGEPTPAGGREEQMDAIRRMLDDLKRSAEDEPPPEPEAEAEPATPRSRRPEPAVHRRNELEDDDPDTGGDPLRSRLARMENDGRSGKAAKRTTNYDAVKLRKMHEKRARRMQKARERKRGSSGFLTGFTLVAAVAAVMVGLYVLQPQIAASSPQMAPAMNEYVVTVDRYRVALDNATADWREWVAERVGPLLGGEDEQAQGAQSGQTG